MLHHITSSLQVRFVWKTGVTSDGSSAESVGQNLRTVAPQVSPDPFLELLSPYGGRRTPPPNVRFTVTGYFGAVRDPTSASSSQTGIAHAVSRWPETPPRILLWRHWFIAQFLRRGCCMDVWVSTPPQLASASLQRNRRFRAQRLISAARRA